MLEVADPVPARAAIPVALREKVRRLEAGQAALAGRLSLAACGLRVQTPADGQPASMPELDRGRLHRLVGGADPAVSDLAAGAVAGFAARVAARLATQARPCLWLGAGYGPGLARLGLGPGTLILGRTREAGERLWAAEQALADGSLAVVVVALARLGDVAARRLQLAAERGGTTALVRLSAAPSDPGRCWRIMPRGGAVAAACWQVTPPGAERPVLLTKSPDSTLETATFAR